MNARRPGFTLIEMLVVTVLATITLGAVYQTLAVQERHSRQQNAVIQTHQINRTALNVLAAELREISSLDGDILAASKDAITILAARKLGVVCGIPGSMELQVRTLGDPFARGDTLFIFADVNPDTRNDDYWVEARVSGVVDHPVCGVPWYASDTLRQDLTITIPASGGSFDEILNGAPVRSVSEVTYTIDQVDGQWVMARVLKGGAPVTMIGPLLPKAEGGLVFTYFNAAGTELTTNPLTSSQLGEVRRVQITVQGAARSGVGGQRHFTEPLVTEVSLRGN